jgi:hypothetical protein
MGEKACLWPVSAEDKESGKALRENGGRLIVKKVLTAGKNFFYSNEISAGNQGC